MNGLLPYFLIALMLLAAWSDIRRREIDNWLNASIALLAPLYWWTSGYALWPDMAVQLLIGIVVLVAFAGLFALGAMGGGDVKMLAAVALWLSPPLLFPMLFVMAVAGGLLAGGMLVAQKMKGSKKILEVPYGVAIAAGGIWAISNNILTNLQH